MAIAGKVAITPKGEWNSETAYTKLDLVFYDNASYVATKPSTGVIPTDESHWMLVVQSAGGADLDGIIDGSIQVGNSKTLDGHEAEYFATLIALKNAMKCWQFTGDNSVKNDEELNTFLQSLHDNAVNSSHYNEPLFINYSSRFSGGQKWVEGYRQSDSYGWQKITYWHFSGILEYKRSLYNGEWTEWEKDTTESDLTAELAKYLPLDGSLTTNYNKVSDLDNFFSGICLFTGSIANMPGNSHWLIIAGSAGSGTVIQIAFDLLQNSGAKQRYRGGTTWNGWVDLKANYVPLTGGQVKGTFSVRSDTASAIWTDINNTLRRVYQTIYSDGGYALVDGTNGKNIILSMLDGENNTFYGHSSKDLPLDGGGTVKGASNAFFALQNTSTNQIYTRYLGVDGELLGYLGFSAKNKPAYNDGSTICDLLHTGNISDYITTDTEVGTFNLKVGNATLSGYEYTKIGKFVYLSGSVPYSGEPLSLDSGVEVSGLPFAMGSIPYLYFGTSIYIPTNKATDNLVVYLGGTLGTTFQIQKNGSITSLANGAPCVLHAMYITE